MKQILKTLLQRGRPYLFFKDTVNRANPNKHDGYIPSGNLCMESYSNVKAGKSIHCCNLVSLNLATITEKEIAKYATLAVRILDNTIDLTTPPVPEANYHNDLYRTIGVGLMGLADWLAVNKLTYSDIVPVDILMNKFSFACIKASMNLAKERGAYAKFEGSDWSKGIINGHSADWFTSEYGNKEWLNLIEDIKEYGIRNSHVMAIAPTTSSSLLQGCTSSVLPLFNRFFMNKSGKHTVPIVPPYIYEYCYQISKDIDSKIVIEMISTIQKWIDTGISMELLFDSNKSTAKEFFDDILYAWQAQCKAVYYVRNIQKTIQPTECIPCAN